MFTGSFRPGSGSFVIRPGSCILCHKKAELFVMDFLVKRDTKGEPITYWELLKSDSSNAACKSCWREIGLYISSETLNKKQPSKVRNKFIEILKSANGKVVIVDEIATKMYGKKDPLALHKVRRYIDMLRKSGYDIETDWGRGYRLIAEPPEPSLIVEKELEESIPS